MMKNLLPFDFRSVLKQVGKQVPDPGKTNHFKRWVSWVTERLASGSGMENIIFVKGTEPELIVRYTGLPTVILYTGETGRPLTRVRVRWYNDLPVNTPTKLTVIMAQSLVDNVNNEFSMTIEADDLDIREFYEPATYSDSQATLHEQLVYLKRPTMSVYLVKTYDEALNKWVVKGYGFNESEAIESDLPPGGGGGTIGVL